MVPMAAAVLQVQVKESHGALLRKELESRCLLVGRRRLHRTGLQRRFDHHDVAACSHRLFRAHRHGAGRSLLRLDREDRALVEHRRQQDVPLGLDHLGVVAYDIESEETGKRFADQFGRSGLPERFRLLVRGADSARIVQHENGDPGRIQARIRDCQRLGN